MVRTIPFSSVLAVRNDLRPGSFILSVPYNNTKPSAIAKGDEYTRSTAPCYSVLIWSDLYLLTDNCFKQPQPKYNMHISLGECNTILSASTLYRHLG